jgi:hypothetical protein
MNVWMALGIAAGVLSCVEAVPYVRDVLRGTTRPHRGTWCIWSVLGLTAFASQIASGAGWSLLMVGVTAAGVTVVFVLSISRGVGGIVAPDRVLMAVAALGIVGWVVSAQPLVATVCVVVADLAGVLLMMPKTWRDPRSETASSFVLAAGSGALGAAAVGSLDVDLLLYPAYFGAVNAFTAAVILLRRRSVAPAPTQPWAAVVSL